MNNTVGARIDKDRLSPPARLVDDQKGLGGYTALKIKGQSR